MKKVILLALFLTASANAGTLFYRAHDADSVIIGPVCVPELAGEQYYGALDFDTSGLVIDVYASGNGVDTSFSYTTTNIDNYDGTPPNWGNPPASAIEVEADDDCVRLHIRDEVFAVSNATEWTINFTDAGVLLMDHSIQVLALGTSADAQADVTAALNTYDPPTNTEMIARTITSATYGTIAGQGALATAANLSSHDGALTSVSGEIDNLIITVGTAGAGLTDVKIANAGISSVTFAPDSINANVIADQTFDSANFNPSALRAMGTFNETDIATLPSQTQMTLTAGSSQNDAYTGMKIIFHREGGGDFDCERTVDDYVGSTKTLTLRSACSYNLATSDIARIRSGIGPDGISAVEVATDTIGATEIASNAIGSDELLDNAITASKIAANAIGNSEIATDAIGSDELADSAVNKIVSNSGLVVATGTADSGTQTSFVDATLTTADVNYWSKNIAIVFTSGDIAGQVVCVSSFAPATDTINFTPATTQVVGVHDYSMIAAPACDPFR